MEKLITIDVDYCGDKETIKYNSKKFGVKIEMVEVKRDGKIYCLDQALVSGPKDKVLNWLRDYFLEMNESSTFESWVEEFYPELI